VLKLRRYEMSVRKSELVDGKVVKGVSKVSVMKELWDKDMSISEIRDEMNKRGLEVSYNMVYNNLVRIGEIKRKEK
jgi:hypothetical protein